MLIRPTLKLLAICALCVLMSPALYAQQQPQVPPPPQAQPIIDGITVGAGVSFYQGDLDFNPPNNPIAFMGVADFNVFATVDRRVGPVILEAGLQYDRLRINTVPVEVDFNLISLDLLIGGARTDIIPDLFYVRPFVGLAPGLQIPNYRRIARPEEGIWAIRDGVSDFERFTELDTRFVLTIPFGLVFQDALRIGMRVALNDDFDGMTGGRGPIDLVTFFNFGYRFDLLR